MYRTILQLSPHVGNSGLRGEIGTSSCYDRDMRPNLVFSKYLMKESRNNVARNTFIRELENGNTKWITTLQKYMNKLSINTTHINSMTKYNIVERVKKLGINFTLSLRRV